VERLDATLAGMGDEVLRQQGPPSPRPGQPPRSSGEPGEHGRAGQRAAQVLHCQRPRHAATSLDTSLRSPGMPHVTAATARLGASAEVSLGAKVLGPGYE
jgi:hypothetical protein